MLLRVLLQSPLVQCHTAARASKSKVSELFSASSINYAAAMGSGATTWGVFSSSDDGEFKIKFVTSLKKQIA